MRPHRYRLVALALVFGAAVVSGADQTDDYVKAQMQAQRIPGLSLAVVQDGKIVKAAGYGLADRKLQVAATPETVYKIGSVSKQFVATGIMLLVQDRKLGLDDAIGKHIEGTPPAWDRITIRQLLTHTAGLVREAPGFDWQKVQPDADVIETAFASPLRFAPGDKYEYSNTGYFALAEIIRKVSGEPWEDYLAERVFRPLGMSSTRPTNTREPPANRAAGYSDNDRLQDAPAWAALRPSGAFLSTVLDLAKWDAALYSDRILTESSRRTMWTAVTLNDGKTSPYGFGWQVDSVDGHKQVHHGGALPGFRSEFTRFVDDGLAVIGTREPR